MANPPPPWLRPDNEPDPQGVQAGPAPGTNPVPPGEAFDPNKTVRIERGSLPLPPAVEPDAAPAPSPSPYPPPAPFPAPAAPTAPPSWSQSPPAPAAPWEASAAPAPAYGAPTYAAPPGYGQAGYGAPPSVAYAGFGARLGARIIDSLVITAIALPFIIGGIVALVKAFDDCFSIGDEIFCPPGARKDGLLALGIILISVGVLIGLIFHIRWIGKRGQTPGMKAAHIKVVDSSTGQPIGIGRSIGRFFAQYLSALPVYLGFFWMLWDERKQTWHDKMVNSVVIKV